MKLPLDDQLLAVHIYMRGSHDDHKRISDDSWDQLLVASGIWAKASDRLLPAILRNAELITTSGNAFMTLPDFRTDMVHMASKEPAVAVSAFGDIASWFVQSAGRLRRAKQQVGINLSTAGANLPGGIMAAAEASELNHLQYMASIAIDVDLHGKAMEKLEEEKETAEKQ